MERRQIAQLEDLKAARTIKFHYKQEGIEREGFLVWHQEQVVAFENSCRHIPITLDYGDGRFFTRDGKFLVCQTHGATYEPLTGYCVAGPCAGASLKQLSVQVQEGCVFLLLTPDME